MKGGRALWFAIVAFGVLMLLDGAGAFGASGSSQATYATGTTTYTTTYFNGVSTLTQVITQVQSTTVTLITGCNVPSCYVTKTTTLYTTTTASSVVIAPSAATPCTSFQVACTSVLVNVQLLAPGSQQNVAGDLITMAVGGLTCPSAFQGPLQGYSPVNFILPTACTGTVTVSDSAYGLVKTATFVPGGTITLAQVAYLSVLGVVTGGALSGGVEMLVGAAFIVFGGLFLVRRGRPR